MVKRRTNTVFPIEETRERELERINEEVETQIMFVSPFKNRSDKLTTLIMSLYFTNEIELQREQEDEE